MGCDVHMFVEKKPKGKNKPWTFVEKFTPPDRDFGQCNSFYQWRNYTLFSVLAGVRGGEEPISAPRGLPDYVSKAIDAEAMKWGPDAHSFSWLTVRELLNYDWSKVHESVSDFLKDCLIPLMGAGSPDDVRIVFWFDS